MRPNTDPHLTLLLGLYTGNVSLCQLKFPKLEEFLHLIVILQDIRVGEAGTSIAHDVLQLAIVICTLLLSVLFPLFP